MGTARKKSQVEPDEFAYELLSGWGISKIETPQDLVELNNKLQGYLKVLPYNDKTREEEAKIRWRRAGAEVLRDGWVYKGKACTDVVVSYLTFCKALGVKGRFVKLKSITTPSVHSIVETKLKDGWYTYNLNDKQPEKGEIVKGKPYGKPPWGPYLLWNKGRDAWDLGLVNFESIKEIK